MKILLCIRRHESVTSSPVKQTELEHLTNDNGEKFQYWDDEMGFTKEEHK